MYWQCVIGEARPTITVSNIRFSPLHFFFSPLVLALIVGNPFRSGRQQAPMTLVLTSVGCWLLFDDYG
jgi:hypothetical protein